MNDSIVWKEAKSGQFISDSSEEEDSNELSSHENTLDDGEKRNFKSIKAKQIATDCSVQNSKTIASEVSKDDESTDCSRRLNREEFVRVKPSSHARRFLHNRINLSLRRNITALANPKHHKPKTTFMSDDSIPFDCWLENAIVAMSPNADLIIFAHHKPRKETFIAKLRMEPVNQYTTKSLEIPLDYNEQVTSLLCLPIMSNQKTALGSVDWTALVIGLSSGYVKFYTEQNICLLSLKFCDEPVVSLKCQTLKSQPNGRSETHFATMTDDFMVVHQTSAVVADGLLLYENLRLAKDELLRNGSNYEPAYNLENLPSIFNCQRWKIDDSNKGCVIMDGELLGTRRTTTFDSMMSDSINFEHIPAKSFTKTLAFVGRNPFVSCYRESNDTNEHSYTEMIGSIFSLWSKPQPSRTQITDITKYNCISLFDKERLATSIVASPDKRLAAVTDDFGRVTLIDTTNWLVIRMWKGYRSAQCGWSEVRRNPEKRNSPNALFLIIYAPKRGLLEVWSIQRGPRVAAFNVGKNCKLLYSGFKMLNMRANKSSLDSHQLTEQSYSSHCYLLNAKSETIFSIELPYTYSLYKYGDLKSRDHLLVGELSVALQNDSDVDVLIEIIHRIALAESLEISIQKVVAALKPEKIVPILENLILKTMKNYDNHAGETMTDDDLSIIELCKRLIRLCSIYIDLTNSNPQKLLLPDVNQRLIDQYEEHPGEIDEFSEQLGWSTTEILRYLSLLSLERSYRVNYSSNPWPSLGEPLTWPEFVSCFDLSRIRTSSNRRARKDSKRRSETRSFNDLSIRLKETKSSFLNQDKVIKTAIFLYNKLCENFFNSIQMKTTPVVSEQSNQIKGLSNYNYLEPATRLGLLFQFWLTTDLCNHWKMWLFLQKHVGLISDELKIIAMDKKDDSILTETWKQIYNSILESDNIFAAITATAVIKSDTLRMIQDNEKREKLNAKLKAGQDDVVGNDLEENEDDEASQGKSSLDWECLCIDAERMSLLSQQLEDIFLLNLLLRYSVKEGYLVNNYVYRVPRISVANVFKAGPTIISELIAQWAVQSNLNLKIFTQPYGVQSLDDSENPVIIIKHSSSTAKKLHDSKHGTKLYVTKQPDLDNEEHAKELLHHVKSSFPCSLEADVILVYCIWELGKRWTSDPASIDKSKILKRVFEAIMLIHDFELKQKLTNVAYKTFFQITLERLIILVETNSTIVNVKNAKLRDTLTRKELNIGEDCLEEFVQFCCDLSEFMLQTESEVARQKSSASATTSTATTLTKFGELDADESDEARIRRERLLNLDNWWSTPTMANNMLQHTNNVHQVRQTGGGFVGDQRKQSNLCTLSDSNVSASINTTAVADSNFASPLTRTILLSQVNSLLFNVNYLIELNRLANLLNLIFKLRIIKAYPISLIGEESRQILQLDLHHSTSNQIHVNLKARSSSIVELRQRFAKKCILNIVGKLSDEISDFVEDENDSDGVDSSRVAATSAGKAGKHCGETPFVVDKTSLKEKQFSAGAESTLAGANNRQLEAKANSGNVCSINDDGADAVDLVDENNESMVLFANLLALATDWSINCDDLHLDLVLELYRRNHDEMASQLATRIYNQQTLASSLLKILSQRTLVLFGLSPTISSEKSWKLRRDLWSMFQPNVSSWLKKVQQEELRRELTSLSFSDSARVVSNKSANSDGEEEEVDDCDDSGDDDACSNDNRDYLSALGVHLFVLHKLRKRTCSALEGITNHLDGQASRLAYDLLELLESDTFDNFIRAETRT